MVKFEALSQTLLAYQHQRKKVGVVGGVGGKNTHLSKICLTCPTMMKLGTVTPYLKTSAKYINHMVHLLSSVDNSIFSLKISNFFYSK